MVKRADRSWYWGPTPLTNGLYEGYSETPYGRRLVQYFDKARMEINSPLTQTMEGGNRAAGNGYKLEEVRNVTYFFQDYAIHGSYWHAKFGL